jgi:hypothetical protein
VLRLFASPNTHLSQFLSGAAATTSALAGVAPTISSLLSDGATTFAALQNAGTALGSTIDQLPQTESTGTTVLTNAKPVLTDAAAIAQALGPGAAVIPLAGERLDALLRTATPVFKLVPRVAATLQTALSTVDKLAKDPASTQTFKVLDSSDLATFGSSAFVGLGAILRTVAPAQFACNVTGPWLRNFASSLSEGDNTAPWLRAILILKLDQMLMASKPSPDLHVNTYPIENASQCQAGNEGYGSGQVIGDPGRTSTKVDNTTPPSGVLERGRAAGLVP